jgi:hypothetical protein
MKAAAARLGHNPALRLNTYAHVVPSAGREAADRLAGGVPFLAIRVAASVPGSIAAGQRRYQRPVSEKCM